MRKQRGIAVIVGLVIGGAAAVGIPSVGAVTYGISTNTLEVVLSGSGAGTVTSDPAGIDCRTGIPAECEREFGVGVEIRLTATPNDGSTFGSWTDCPFPSGNICDLQLDHDMIVGASFVGPAPSAPASKNLLLAARPRKVKKGHHTNLKGTIRPCTAATQNDRIQFLQKGTLVADIPVSPECVVELPRRITGRTLFEAFSPSDADSGPAESNDVTVKVKKAKKKK